MYLISFYAINEIKEDVIRFHLTVLLFIAENIFQTKLK